ncbi:MAG: YifB family Mg chelatase-like AAA ATPase [Synechococcus sp. MOX_bin73]|nr:YifB family Mg chelatase-like AAA ATPase [Synechococcus sp. MOX_bin73]
MLARCLSASLHGLEAKPVTVEVDLAPGLPGIQLVGLADKAIQESRERVRSALRNSGFRGPLVRVVINLAPADRRKEGPAFDLPISLGLLVASGQLDRPKLDGLWCAGELGLDGSLRPCRGVIALADLARQQGARALIVPPANAPEAALIPNLTIWTANNLKELVQQLKGECPIVRIEHNPSPQPATPAAMPLEPLGLGIEGMDRAAHALALAAAGGHHLLMVGPPGCGKTHLARQLPLLLPPLTTPESLTITRIHSVAGEFNASEPLLHQRPFRSAHHSCSGAALLGGGHTPKPGEISLAHGGVLFLDELAEFPRRVLDLLRQPLEDGNVRLSRSRETTVFPAAVTLVAATNPCPCGWHGDSAQACRCTRAQRQRYWQRLSGPLLDRIDLQLRLERRSSRQMRRCLEANPSPQIHSAWLKPSRVKAARRRMHTRNPRGCSNRFLTTADLHRYGQFEANGLTLWERVIEQRRLTTRSSLQLLRVARTIADLNGQDTVPTEAIADASGFRCTDLMGDHSAGAESR